MNTNRSGIVIPWIEVWFKSLPISQTTIIRAVNEPVVMNNQNRKLCAYAAMAIALSLSPLAAQGQTSASPASSPTTSSQTTVADDRGNSREHHNYGWIGLLGLLGLTGLMRKRQEDGQVYSARTDARRTAASSRS